MDKYVLLLPNENYRPSFLGGYACGGMPPLAWFNVNTYQWNAGFNIDLYPERHALVFFWKQSWTGMDPYGRLILVAMAELEKENKRMEEFNMNLVNLGNYEYALNTVSSFCDVYKVGRCLSYDSEAIDEV